ncbi:type II toxin-antitoxin system PemK/MazF family toxin [Clostridium beijerinckii]|uniref:type II toxin-antitoxin system PemK/MazF family toxin n=1 Tax=Clostridium beijerinckii TaxID=1520 RepID=UPI001813658D|nr:type II toxin-antitoxin system PemK/MazF family toxin [Clostridium beijerinckii]NRU52568.1 mRNA-degrading endonuclease toxin of MazEF toxin-antitoxin module [Clostridium beijerinckii]NYC69255.1 mRNA-degrading endonuclease toxin of MazEF toxin-antitoxin module [Clostridium beijerinckii]NYC91769.1 mRNA-degrading endonuclease toxin of MazEF toxin-antitoxin module [Clostridium beijerinckii]
MSGKSKKKDIQPQEVWYVNFPFEENPNIKKRRPVVVLGKTEDKVTVAGLEVDAYLSVKITSHTERKEDEYDTIIVKWKEANLKKESVARVSKTIILPKSQFIDKVGIADDEDFENILTKYIELTESFDDRT